MPIIIKAVDLNQDFLLKKSAKGFFEDFTPSIVPSRMHEIVRISSDGLSLKLIDKNQKDLLSFVHGNIITYRNIKYFEIESAYSKFKKNGFLTYLFKLLIYELGYKILSDSRHSSPGSKEFWQSHMKKKDFSIYRLNLATNYKRKANRFKDSEIWFEMREEPLYTILNSYNYFINEGIDDDIQEIEDFEGRLEIDEIDQIEESGQITDIQAINSSNSKIRLVAQKYIK